MARASTFSYWLTLILVLLACVAALPNVLSKNARDSLPSWLPNQTINLGLDLQGGSYLLLEVDMEHVENRLYQDVLTNLRLAFVKARVQPENVSRKENIFTITLPSETSWPDISRAVQNETIYNGSFRTQSALNNVIFELDPALILSARQVAINKSIEIVRLRVDETGTREPLIQQQGANRILLQLPGIDNPKRLKELIGTTAQMNFHLVNDSIAEPLTPTTRVPPNTIVLPLRSAMGLGAPQYIAVFRQAMVNGETLVDAQATFQDGRPVVSFRFNTVGATRFGRATQENVNKLFAIVLDNEVISAPRINEPILGGSGIITGQFTVQEANDLALLLRSGALPAPLDVVEERSIGPGLGADSVEAGKIASIIAFAVIIVFMVASYGVIGILAAIALIVNVIIMFALLSSLQATLTLPGIAGIVLTLGMAVDANILIFERIREEVAIGGRQLFVVLSEAYNKSLGTIMDANITTLLAALILFMFGTGPVKGFAVTLGLGVLTSLFCAFMVTRLLMLLWVGRDKSKLSILGNT
jgi:preprotein translocase subunit SecD